MALLTCPLSALSQSFTPAEPFIGSHSFYVSVITNLSPIQICVPCASPLHPAFSEISIWMTLTGVSNLKRLNTECLLFHCSVQLPFLRFPTLQMEHHSPSYSCRNTVLKRGLPLPASFHTHSIIMFNDTTSKTSQSLLLFSISTVIILI